MRCSVNLTRGALGRLRRSTPTALGGNWCAESTHTCTPQLANGVALPAPIPRTPRPTLNATCTAPAATPGLRQRRVRHARQRLRLRERRRPLHDGQRQHRLPLGRLQRRRHLRPRRRLHDGQPVPGRHARGYATRPPAPASSARPCEAQRVHRRDPVCDAATSTCVPPATAILGSRTGWPTPAPRPSPRTASPAARPRAPAASA